MIPDAANSSQIGSSPGRGIRSYPPDFGCLPYQVILYTLRSYSGPWIDNFDERDLKYHILSCKRIVQIDCYHRISDI